MVLIALLASTFAHASEPALAQEQRLTHRQRELVLYPATIQANGKFTQHVGSAASFIWRVNEDVGVQLSGHFNWSTSESAFNRELISKVREEAQAATSMLLVWAVHAGLEMSP